MTPGSVSWNIEYCRLSYSRQKSEVRRQITPLTGCVRTSITAGIAMHHFVPTPNAWCQLLAFAILGNLASIENELLSLFVVLVCHIFVSTPFPGGTHRETPLVIAIRAGQASAAELLVHHGAPLDGGRSHNRLTAADGRTPAGAREKMLARRYGREGHV